MLKKYSIHAKADGGYLREDQNGDLVKFADVDQLSYILGWAEEVTRKCRVDGSERSEEVRIAWAILNAPR